MESVTRTYEISFVLRAEEDLANVVALLKEHGADITDEGQVRKLALAYPIKRVTDGYFGYLMASMEPEAAKKLENTMRTSSAALRLMIQSTKPEKAPKEVKKSAARRERPAAPAGAVTNDDLQKELEKLTADAS